MTRDSHGTRSVLVFFLSLVEEICPLQLRENTRKKVNKAFKIPKNVTMGLTTYGCRGQNVLVVREGLRIK